MEIVEAVPEQAMEILALQKLAYQSEAILYDDFNIPPLTEQVDKFIDEFKVKTLLNAVEDGRIIGTIRGYQDRDTCFIGRLGVHPDWQGRGIGSKLMFAIEDTFKDVKRYEVFTGYKSEPNLKLYAKLGYKPFKEETIYKDIVFIFLEKDVPE